MVVNVVFLNGIEKVSILKKPSSEIMHACNFRALIMHSRASGNMLEAISCCWFSFEEYSLSLSVVSLLLTSWLLIYVPTNLRFYHNTTSIDVHHDKSSYGKNWGLRDERKVQMLKHSIILISSVLTIWELMSLAFRFSCSTGGMLVLKET